MKCEHSEESSDDVQEPSESAKTLSSRIFFGLSDIESEHRRSSFRIFRGSTRVAPTTLLEGESIR